MAKSNGFGKVTTIRNWETKRSEASRTEERSTTIPIMGFENINILLIIK